MTIIQDEISLVKVSNGVDGSTGEKGKDGSNGTNGTNGKDVHVHTAYSWSADGKDRFTTVYPNENLLIGTKEVLKLENATSNVPHYKPFKLDIDPLNIKGEKLIISAYIKVKNAKLRTQAPQQTRIGVELNYLTSAPNGRLYHGVWKSLVDGENFEGYISSGLMTMASDVLSLGGAGSYIQANGEYLEIKHVKYEIVNSIGVTVRTIYTPSPKDDFINAYPAFVGTYSSNNLTQSNNPSDYTWARIRGNDGKDGDNGKDGQTPKDVISGYLSNDAVIVPATPIGTVTDYSKAFGDFIVFEGQDKKNGGVTYSKISEIGMISTISSAGRYAISALSADSGTATYRATYAGVSIDKILIAVKNKQGATGNAGNTGGTGPKGDNGNTGGTGPKGDKGDKGNVGDKGTIGDKGDPTGVLVSPTVPTQKFINMLWQNTGTNNGYINGVVYQWNGAKWNIFIFSAENIMANTLSAITANLGKVTGGEITGSKFINEGIFNDPSLGNAEVDYKTIIDGPINMTWSPKDGKNSEGRFSIAPYMLSSHFYPNKNNLYNYDWGWILDKRGYLLKEATSGIQHSTNIKPGKIELDDNKGHGTLSVSDVIKKNPEQLSPVSGYTVYSTSRENRPTAKRCGRGVTLSGAFKNNSNVTSDDTEVQLCRLPNWAIPEDVERTIVQGTGINRFLLTVRPDGFVYWSRYGSSSYGTAGAGSWLNINIRYDGADL